MSKKNMKIIFLIAMACIFNITEAKNYDTKTDYFIAKKLLKNKNYIKADFILKNIIKENNKNDKYTIKAKILKTLIHYKKNELDQAKYNIDTISKFSKKEKKYNMILYLKGIIYYNFNINFLQNIFKIKRYQHEQTLQYKSLLAFKKIKNEIKNTTKIKTNIKIIRTELSLHKINLGKFYINKKAYIAAINRLDNKNKLIKIKENYDYQKAFLILKSYNELFLDKISKNIFKNIKNYDRIKTSSNLLHH